MLVSCGRKPRGWVFSQTLADLGNKEVAQRIGGSHSIPDGPLSPLVTWTILGIPRVLCCSFLVFVEPWVVSETCSFYWFVSRRVFGHVVLIDLGACKRKTYTTHGALDGFQKMSTWGLACALNMIRNQDLPLSKEKKCMSSDVFSACGSARALMPLAGSGRECTSSGPFYTLFSWLAKGDHV